MHRLDGVWTDLFWQHRNDYHEIDQQMMAFIRTVLINHRATKSMDREDSALQRLLAEDELWFSDFMVEDAIDAEALVFLANSLNGFGQPVSSDGRPRCRATVRAGRFPRKHPRHA